jgi:phospholipid/cholesterol/gamma-HCH transport system substrate-binding protein
MSENYSRAEIVTGMAVLVGVLYAVYITISSTLWGDRTYVVYADFISVSGLHIGDPVEIAGVSSGKVESIGLANHQGRVGFRIKDSVALRQNAVAKIEIDGLLGDRTVSINPGDAGKTLEPGDFIEKTESPKSFQYLIGRSVAGDLL